MTAEYAKKAVAIVNPAAGGGRCGQKAPRALEELRKAGLRVEARETRAPGDATRLAREAYQEGVRHFIAVGGDGTCFETLNGFLPLSLKDQERVTFGILPAGTGNSFLRHFTNGGTEESIRAIIEQRAHPCDVIELKHKHGVLYFSIIFGIGFVAEVGAHRNHYFRGWGESGYALSVLAKTMTLEPRVFPMRIDHSVEHTQPLTFLSICNSRYTGGKMMMAPSADTSDGQMDLIEVGPMGRFRLMESFPKIFKGTHVRMPEVSTSRAEAIEFDFDQELNVMIDGEVLRLWPEKLRVLNNVMDVQV
ncbi:MAG TPA: diacylglycerol kinase family protein [Bdellovibrionota bacterium]|nr:diacylglycerol kinase family protein [Bdellovibrionota bacterium]